ncbi:diacylglycerol kinase [Ruegeria lacuscaerulensis]|uniref:diacylglycerol kinase n=1 Tax=Ruegeria lacuscaerulensis TaxID=55218 RepID=UPI00147B04C4|nr:diacylglycerol kinase [Ruegeria lacuscaerulensis]
MKNFLIRLKHRTVWSWQGLAATWRDEYSFRVWGWANLISVGLAIGLPLSGGMRALIVIMGILVLVAELFNTAIERAVDHTSTDHNTLAGQAKDAASAAVALTAIAAAVAWMAGLVAML